MKTAERLGYKANQFTQMTPDTGVVSCTLCKQSGKRATTGCAAAGTSYVDQVPVDVVPAKNDLCPIHPIKAVSIDEDTPPRPSDRPLRAQPVDEPSRTPLRAQPLEEPSQPLRAQPVE
jgi:hypothetical protein